MSYNPWSTTEYAAYRRARYAAAHPDGAVSAQPPPPAVLSQDPPPQDPPPSVTPAAPTAPAFDLATSDPEGWARYQREVAGDKDKEIADERAATAAVLPPLSSGQNMYYLYDANGDMVRKYTPSQAIRLPPDEAAKLVAVTEDEGYVKSFYHYGQHKGDDWWGDVWSGSGPKRTKQDTDPISKAARSVESGVGSAVNAVEGVFTGGARLGGDLLHFTEWVLEYAPYLLMIGAAGTVVYIAAPLVSAARSASSGRHHRSSRPE